MENNSIKIITPFYNPGKFLEQCVSSAVSQKYNNYEIIFVDDCSTDGSYDKLPKDDDRVTIIKNQVRKTALDNLHNAIMNHCKNIFDFHLRFLFLFPIYMCTQSYNI